MQVHRAVLFRAAVAAGTGNCARTGGAANVAHGHAAAAFHVGAPPFVRVGNAGEHLAAVIIIVVLRRGGGVIAKIIRGRQAHAVFLGFVAQAHRAADVPHGVVGILLAHVIIDEAREGHGRRRRRVLRVNAVDGGEDDGTGGECFQVQFHGFSFDCFWNRVFDLGQARGRTVGPCAARAITSRTRAKQQSQHADCVYRWLEFDSCARPGVVEDGSSQRRLIRLGCRRASDRHQTKDFTGNTDGYFFAATVENWRGLGSVPCLPPN